MTCMLTLFSNNAHTKKLIKVRNKSIKNLVCINSLNLVLNLLLLGSGQGGRVEGARAKNAHVWSVRVNVSH